MRSKKLDVGLSLIAAGAGAGITYLYFKACAQFVPLENKIVAYSLMSVFFGGAAYGTLYVLNDNDSNDKDGPDNNNGPGIRPPKTDPTLYIELKNPNTYVSPLLTPLYENV